MTATTRRHGGNYCWVTWLTGLLAGDKHCLFAAWYRAHFKYEKRRDDNFDSAAWSAAHNALVLKRKAELEADGWTVTVEGQNDFKLKGKAALLAGKPDLIAVRKGEALVVDCKTGRPRNSDFWQVLLYLLALRFTRPGLPPVSGEVCYPDSPLTVVRDDLTPAREGQIYALLRDVGSDDRPETTPSKHECSFCDIADCADRFVEADEQPTAETVNF